MNTSYTFPVDSAQRIRLRMEADLRDAYAPRSPLQDHPCQWAGALINSDIPDRKTLILQLLYHCPNKTWVEEGSKNAIEFLSAPTKGGYKRKLSLVTVTGIMIRNLYFLLSNYEEPQGYRVLAFLATVIAAWNYVTVSQDPGPGVDIYIPDGK